MEADIIRSQQAASRALNHRRNMTPLQRLNDKTRKNLSNRLAACKKINLTQQLVLIEEERVESFGQQNINSPRIVNKNKKEYLKEFDSF